MFLPWRGSFDSPQPQTPEHVRTGSAILDCTGTRIRHFEVPWSHLEDCSSSFIDRVKRWDSSKTCFYVKLADVSDIAMKLFLDWLQAQHDDHADQSRAVQTWTLENENLEDILHLYIFMQKYRVSSLGNQVMNELVKRFETGTPSELSGTLITMAYRQLSSEQPMQEALVDFCSCYLDPLVRSYLAGIEDATFLRRLCGRYLGMIDEPVLWAEAQGDILDTEDLPKLRAFTHTYSGFVSICEDEERINRRNLSAYRKHNGKAEGEK
ncbi:hypothetical protein IQ07DRAFT_645586 [Pyrenochaeta sp. DS3sAY3a]|nr:hypothetical protein IQ07DRAFT_645586 [Pyrenochaeta sp. DS3sAY3a]